LGILVNERPALSLQRATWLALGIVLVVGLTYAPPLYQGIGPRGVLWIYDLSVTFSTLVAAGLSLQLWRSFQPGEMLRRIWGYLALGLLLWAVGDTVWSYDQLLAGDSLPTPSFADIAWILGFIPFISGLYLRFRSLRMNPRRGWRVWLLVLVTLVGVIVTSGVILPIIRSSDNQGPFCMMVDLLYPLGDLVLLFMTLLVTLVHIGGKLSYSWGWISLGFFTLAVSNLTYVFAVSKDLYQVDPGSTINILSVAINLLYLAGYIYISLGLYSKLKLQGVH
jgi:hypothetical protein